MATNTPEWYLKNKQLRLQYTFKDGVMNGQAKEFFPNGQKKVETFFKNDGEHGIHVEWHKNGTKMYETTYINGRWGKYKQWDSKGNMVKDYDPDSEIEVSKRKLAAERLNKKRMRAERQANPNLKKKTKLTRTKDEIRAVRKKFNLRRRNKIERSTIHYY